MNETTTSGRPTTKSMADKTLNAAGLTWYLVAVIGQWAFVAYVASF